MVCLPSIYDLMETYAERLLTYREMPFIRVMHPAAMKMADDLFRFIDIEPSLIVKAIVEEWDVLRISHEVYSRLRHISKCPVCGIMQLGSTCCDRCWEKHTC